MCNHGTHQDLLLQDSPSVAYRCMVPSAASPTWCMKGAFDRRPTACKHAPQAAIDTHLPWRPLTIGVKTPPPLPAPAAGGHVILGGLMAKPQDLIYHMILSGLV